MENGFNPIPLKENSPWVIARKEPLVVEVKQGNKLYIVISKANDPMVKYGASVEVDAQVNLVKIDPKWSAEKQKSLKNYLTEHQKEYKVLLDSALNKRLDIIN